LIRGGRGLIFLEVEIEYQFQPAFSRITPVSPMVLCICHAVTERELDAAIEGGAHTLAEIAERLGAGSDCGCCQNEIEQRLESLTGPCGRSCTGCPRASAEVVSAA
jgi:bacterioferritin-associated ferredoxin